MRNLLDEDLAFNSKRTIEEQYGKIYYTLLCFLAIGAIIATLVSCIEIESIIISGFLLSVIGIFLLLYGRKAKMGLNYLIGWIPIVMSLVWLMLISVLGLSPGDCEIVVPFSLAMALFVILIWSGFIFVEKVRQDKQARE